MATRRRQGRSARSRRGRLRTLDALTLAAVALVVLLVSLPRLEDLAIRENEDDAARLAQRLAALAEEGGSAPVDRLLTAAPDLAQRLDDVELLAEGRVLRRHGYLFEALPAEGPARALRVWPWEYGRTGRVAFVWTPEGGLLGHANGDAHWTGTEGPPPATHEGGGWCGVRVR